MIIEPRACSIEELGELIRHPGEEFAYVLEGVTELHTDTYAPLTLHPGNSIYFDSGMAHAFIAVGEGRCRILLVSSAPEPNSGVMKTPAIRAANATGSAEASAARAGAASAHAQGLEPRHAGSCPRVRLRPPEDRLSSYPGRPG